MRVFVFLGLSIGCFLSLALFHREARLGALLAGGGAFAKFLWIGRRRDFHTAPCGFALSLRSERRRRGIPNVSRPKLRRFREKNRSSDWAPAHLRFRHSPHRGLCPHRTALRL